MLKKTLQEYLIAIGIAVSIALFLRAYVIEAFRVPTAVMTPTLLSGDFIFAGKWPFLGSKPRVRYGDVLIYRANLDSRQSYISRVIGLPGDRIEIREGVVHWNGIALGFEPGAGSGGARCGTELHPRAKYQVCFEEHFKDSAEALEIPPNSAFLMTDYRGRIPERSRPTHSIVAFELIRARPYWIWLSLDPESEGFFPRIRFNRLFHSIR